VYRIDALIGGTQRRVFKEFGVSSIQNSASSPKTGSFHHRLQRTSVRRLVEAAASTLVIGFPGTASSPELREVLRLGIGGTILFRRNVVDPVQVAQLIGELQDARLDELPLLISADQEGGRVARLRSPLTEFPDMAWVGRTGDEALAERVAEVLSRELKAVGFNLNFAPVMDVDSNPANPVIGPRAFSSSPEVVSRLGSAMIRTMHHCGILACAKHFPGHGDTLTDSHKELPTLPHSLERLHRLELVPFRASIAAGVKLIMTAHVVFEAIDPSLPATLSQPVLTGLLRQTLGFQGVVVSDDLEMKAVLDHYGIRASVLQGMTAGVDCFLICHTLARVYEAIEALVHEAESDSHFRHRLLEAAARVRVLRAGLGPYQPIDAATVMDHVGLPAHKAVSDDVRRRGAPAQLATEPSQAGVDPTATVQAQAQAALVLAQAEKEAQAAMQAARDAAAAAAAESTGEPSASQ